MGSWKIFELARRPRMFPDAGPGQLVSYWAGISAESVRAYETFQADSITVYAQRVADADGVRVVSMREDGRALGSVGSHIAYDIERAVARLLADGTVTLDQVAVARPSGDVPVVVTYREDEFITARLVWMPVNEPIAWGDQPEQDSPGNTLTRLAHINEIKYACRVCGSLDLPVGEDGTCGCCPESLQTVGAATALETDIPF
jgi:hypothetical protein